MTVSKPRNVDSRFYSALDDPDGLKEVDEVGMVTVNGIIAQRALISQLLFNVPLKRISMGRTKT